MYQNPRMSNLINYPVKPAKFIYLKHYKKEYVKSAYGNLGKKSGLNPGVLWPRKEELSHIKQYEEAFHPPLEELVKENKARKEARALKRAQREKEVCDNLEKLPGQLREFFNKLENLKKEREEWLKKKEMSIEEVREILGYTAKPSDPKFQEALLKKEQEETKARKKAERKARENAALEALLQVAKEVDKKSS